MAGKFYAVGTEEACGFTKDFYYCLQQGFSTKPADISEWNRK